MSFVEGAAEGALEATSVASPAGMRMPLMQVQRGETVRVVKIGGRDATRRHLTELGFVPDAAVTVVTESNGNLICEVKGVRIGLDTELAKRITVIA